MILKAQLNYAQLPIIMVKWHWCFNIPQFTSI